MMKLGGRALQKAVYRGLCRFRYRWWDLWHLTLLRDGVRAIRLLFSLSMFQLLRVNFDCALVRESPFIDHIFDSRHTFTALVIAFVNVQHYTRSDGGAPITLHLCRYEIALSQKNVPQSVEVSEAFSSKLGCTPGSTKDVLHSGLVF